ncbi:hypothetical protein [Formosa sp. A9]|uniref:hypothetical protein n=1 Tax=Formosa sp. A9 TaxID=3442641 RepID=UPI003EBCF7A8
MKRKLFKVFGVILVVVAILLAGLYFYADNIVKHQLEKTVKTLPKTVAFNYQDLKVDVIEGTLQVTKPEVVITEETKNKLQFHIKLQDFIVEDVKFWEYLVYNKIHLTELILQKPEFTYIKKDSLATKTSSDSKSGLNNFSKTIVIDHFNLNDAKVTIFQGSKDSIYLNTKGVNFEINHLLFNQETALSSIPIQYSDYKITTDSLAFQVGEFEKIRIKNMILSNKAWQINDVEFNTIYSKQELSKIIKKERDHFNLAVDNIIINTPEFGFVNKRFYFKSPEVQLERPILEIFRDKLVADDTSIKPLYSKMLRDLSFDLTLDTLLLNSGDIAYQEKIKYGKHAGEITFDNFNAKIKNISNTYTAPTKTEIDVNANFMKTAPIHAVWTFDVNNQQDEFEFKADIGRLPAYRLNTFVETNLNIRVEGVFNKIYTTIHGNLDRSRFTFDVKYDNIKVHVLNKRHQKDKLLSGLANIFIHKDSKHENGNFVHHQNKVVRDKTKSVFNFIWKNVEEGLKESFINRKN